MEENKRDEEKVGFESYELARQELERIVSTSYNVCKKVKPTRIYFSDITKMYHLTSKISVKVY
jgi:hypothetical protein